MLAFHISNSLTDACKLLGTLTDNGDAIASENQLAPSNIPADGVEWVDLFVKEMMSATTLDDAKSRASRVLEVLENSISARAGAEAAQNFQKVRV